MRYEKLPILCFNCGFLGHQRNKCPHPFISVLVGELAYGSWIHTTPISARISCSSMMDLSSYPQILEDHSTNVNEQEHFPDYTSHKHP